MSPALQVRLLRVLEDRRVRPLGGERELPCGHPGGRRDASGPPDDGGRGRFRQDLRARLGLSPSGVPPVRERREDLGLLIRSVLTLLPAGVQSLRFELETLRTLLLHDWPMNVRELRKLLLAAVDLAIPESEGAVVIGPQHVPTGMLGSESRGPPPRRLSCPPRIKRSGHVCPGSSPSTGKRGGRGPGDREATGSTCSA